MEGSPEFILVKKAMTKPIQNGALMERDVKGQFVKGWEGGPGRPEGSISLTETVKRKLRQLHPDGKREAIEVLADNIIQDALESNNKMRTLIWNYVDGMPKQNLKLEGEVKVIPILGGVTNNEVQANNRLSENTQA